MNGHGDQTSSNAAADVIDVPADIGVDVLSDLQHYSANGTLPERVDTPTPGEALDIGDDGTGGTGDDGTDRLAVLEGTVNKLVQALATANAGNGQPAAPATPQIEEINIAEELAKDYKGEDPDAYQSLVGKMAQAVELGQKQLLGKLAPVLQTLVTQHQQQTEGQQVSAFEEHLESEMKRLQVDPTSWDGGALKARVIQLGLERAKQGIEELNNASAARLLRQLNNQRLKERQAAGETLEEIKDSEVQTTAPVVPAAGSSAGQAMVAGLQNTDDPDWDFNGDKFTNSVGQLFRVLNEATGQLQNPGR